MQVNFRDIQATLDSMTRCVNEIKSNLQKEESLRLEMEESQETGRKLAICREKFLATQNEIQQVLQTSHRPVSELQDYQEKLASFEARFDKITAESKLIDLSNDLEIAEKILALAIDYLSVLKQGRKNPEQLPG